MEKMRFHFNKGFTLIELLIVITIIGILAVALLPSVLGAPARARDAARKADVNNIIAALETYNSDNGDYPKAVLAAGSCLQDMEAGLLSLFQGSKAPVDPQGKGYAACTTAPLTGSYLYCKLSGSPASYMVMAEMEVKGDANTKLPMNMPGNCNAVAGGAAPTLVEPGMADPAPWYYVVLK